MISGYGVMVLLLGGFVQDVAAPGIAVPGAKKRVISLQVTVPTSGWNLSIQEVYQAENRRIVQRRFYDLFMSKTQRYVDYSFAQFEREYAIMSTVLFVYYVGMGGAIWRSAAFENEGGGRIELGSEGVTEMDLEAEDLRKRMWWAKAIANFLENFLSDDFADKLTVLPDNVGAMGQWVELPAHLRTR